MHIDEVVLGISCTAALVGANWFDASGDTYPQWLGGTIPYTLMLSHISMAMTMVNQPVLNHE